MDNAACLTTVQHGRGSELTRDLVTREHEHARFFLTVRLVVHRLNAAFKQGHVRGHRVQIDHLVLQLTLEYAAGVRVVRSNHAVGTSRLVPALATRVVRRVVGEAVLHVKTVLAVAVRRGHRHRVAQALTTVEAFDCGRAVASRVPVVDGDAVVVEPAGACGHQRLVRAARSAWQACLSVLAPAAR